MREAEIDAERCDGCQDCIEWCRYDAIHLVRTPPSKRLRAQVDLERCCGCHACEPWCAQHGITMRWIGPPHVAWASY